jgi:DNA-binding transcriptional LysR family regulator
MSSKGKAMSENAPPTRQRPLPLPDLDAFRILLLVGELGSLGRAAVAEGIAQPSATARLAALERRLGIALVDRSPRGSRLTEEGRIVSDWAREVLTAVDTLLAGAHALRSRNAQLRVAASQTIAECLVPEWLREFARREPGVGVGLHVANSAHAIAAVAHGTAQLGFVEGPNRPQELSSRVVGVDRLVVVVHPSHRWATRKRPLTAAELSQAPLVVREAGSGTRETLDRALLGHDAAPPVSELGSNSAVKGAVLAGIAPAVLSVLAVASELATGRLVEVATPELDLRRKLRAVWPRGRRLMGPAVSLLAVAGALAPNVPSVESPGARQSRSARSSGR